MFGCHAVYVDDKIILVLRQKGKPAQDDGIWVATTKEHHESLKNDLPSLRSISVFGPGPTGWQNIPLELGNFESEAERLCELILKRDPRIGKVPAAKKKRETRRPRTR